MKRPSRIKTGLKRIQQNWLVLVGAGTALLIIAWPLLHGRAYAALDHMAQFIPYRMVGANAAKVGEWGFWGPHYFRGFSLLALGEAGVLHPWRMLCARWPDLFQAIAVDMLIAFPLAFIGAYLLGRHYRYDRRVTVIGAAWFTFSVFFTSHFGHTHMITIFAHTPWAVLAYELCVGGARRWLGICGMGVIVASMFLLGHPHTLWFVCLLVAIATLHRGLRMGWNRQWMLGTAFAGSASFAGLGIGLLQLLPTLELLSHHPRGDLSVDLLGNYSSHPLHLLQNLAPGLYPEPPGDWIFMEGGRQFVNNPTSGAVYLGLGLLWLVATGFWLQRRELFAPGESRRSIGFLVLALVLLLLMLGRYGGLHYALWQIPGLDSFRTPHRYKAVLSSIVIAMAVAMLQRWIRRPPTLSRRDWAVLAVMATPVLGAAIFAATRDHVMFETKALNLRPAVWMLWGPAVIGSCTLALWRWRTRSGRALWLPILGLLCLTDLCGYGLPIVRNVQYQSREAIVAFQESHEISNPHPFRLFTYNYIRIWQGERIPLGFAGLLPERQIPGNTIADLRLQNVLDIEHEGKSRRLESPIPRIRLVDQLIATDTPLSNLDELDLLRVATITPQTDWDHQAVAALAAIPNPAAPDHEMRITHDGYDRIEVDVANHRPTLLVVGDRYDPDWRATVNGEASQVLPVYGASMRGVFLPAGTHRIQLTYRPTSLQRAIPWAIASGLILMGLSILAHYLLPAKFASPAGGTYPDSDTPVTANDSDDSAPTSPNARVVDKPPPHPDPPEGASHPLAVATSPRWRPYLVATLATAILVAVRWHSYAEPMELDTSIYTIIAQDWAAGGELYGTYWDNKPIGTFLLWRVILAAFGDPHQGAWIASTIASASCIWLLLPLLNQLRPWIRDSFLLAGWPLFNALSDTHMNGANMEIFLLPCVLGALVCLTGYRDDQRIWRLYVAVLILAAGFCMKQVMLPFLFTPYVSYLAHPPESGRDLAFWRGFLLHAFGGALLAIGLFFGVYLACGIGPGAVLEQQLIAATAGDQAMPFHQRLPRLFFTAPWTPAIRLILPLILAGIAGAVLHLWRRRRGARWLWPATFLAGYLSAVSLGTLAHYFIMIVPGLLLCLALLLHELADRQGRPSRLAVPVAAALLIWLGGIGYWQYFRLTPHEISVRKYGWPWFPYARLLGQELEKRGITGERIYVSGSFAPVYVYSGNKPATRFFTAMNITQGMLDDEAYMQQLRDARPAYCIIIQNTRSLPGQDAFLAEHYERIAGKDEATGADIYQRR